MNRKPLIAHVLHRLDTGGMERVLVTVINGTRHRYRHAIVCLDGFGDIRGQIEPGDTACLALHKKPGKDWSCYLRLWRALRQLKPDMVHTHNIGALDAAPVARLAGVRRVIHAERGRDAADPGGTSRKYRLMRRLLLPCIDRYLAVSQDLRDWLINQVGISPSRVVCIPNGIDVAAFTMPPGSRATRPLLGDFASPGTILLGTVGRLDPVKDQAGLLTAFQLLCEAALPAERQRLRLVIVGEGPERDALTGRIAKLAVASQVRLLGHRDDVPALLAEFDVFVLSSIGEGMPGAVLEAMATGLPVVATAVGGVGELVRAGATGLLVPPRDSQQLAEALASYVVDETLRARHGAAARERIATKFSLQSMLSAYIELYDGLLQRHRDRHPRVTMAAGVDGRREP